jgi:RNA polymerase sigma factor (sigma-70 family)
MWVLVGVHRDERRYRESWCGVSVSKMTKRLNKRTQKIFNKHTNLVDIQVALLRKRIPCYYSTEDMRSYGYIGLIDAIGKYDKSKGAGFETYASKRIRGAILDGIRIMNWAPQKWDHQRSAHPAPLESAIPVPWDDPKRAPEEYGARMHTRAELFRCMDCLRPQSQMVMMLYYFGRYPYLLWEIAGIMNMDESRISQLLGEGRQTMKRILESRGWKSAET